MRTNVKRMNVKLDKLIPGLDPSHGQQEASPRVVRVAHVAESNAVVLRAIDALIRLASRAISRSMPVGET